MSDFEHRAGVSEMNFVIRHLTLEPLNNNNNNNENNMSVLLAEIDQSFGVDNVSFNENSKILTVAYDASHFDVERLEIILEKYSYKIASSWWNHLKESYYKFTDQNIKDNAEHQPSCCHKPPAGKK